MNLKIFALSLIAFCFSINFSFSQSKEEIIKLQSQVQNSKPIFISNFEKKSKSEYFLVKLKSDFINWYTVLKVDNDQLTIIETDLKNYSKFKSNASEQNVLFNEVTDWQKIKNQEAVGFYSTFILNHFANVNQKLPEENRFEFETNWNTYLKVNYRKNIAEIDSIIKTHFDSLKNIYPGLYIPGISIEFHQIPPSLCNFFPFSVKSIIYNSDQYDLFFFGQNSILSKLDLIMVVLDNDYRLKSPIIINKLNNEQVQSVIKTIDSNQNLKFFDSQYYKVPMCLILVF